METTATKVNGHEVKVFFTGPRYIMYSEFYGVIGVAIRDYNKGVVGKTAAFHIIVGNEHTMGGSCGNNAVIAALKRVINKGENKYIPTKVEYTEEVRELKNCNLQVKVIDFDGTEL